jgi:hypothetical protein
MDNSFFLSPSASVARHIYLRRGVGVGALKKLHGGTANRGSRPTHHVKSSGSIARKVLQALEKINVLEADENGYASLALCFFSLFSFVVCEPLLDVTVEIRVFFPYAFSLFLPSNAIVDARSPLTASVTWTALLPPSPRLVLKR